MPQLCQIKNRIPRCTSTGNFIPILHANFQDSISNWSEERESVYREIIRINTNNITNKATILELVDYVIIGTVNRSEMRTNKEVIERGKIRRIVACDTA